MTAIKYKCKLVQALSKRLETHDNFSGLTEEERAHICDLSERYIMICCYKPLFCPFTTSDEEEDLVTQAKIRSLNWVTAAHLDCPFKETAPVVRDVIYTAINDILELDGSRCPQDKLASVVSCSKKVFDVLAAGGTEQASADDFLPSLIYILLKANPPRIWSNINFITRFSNESRLRSGEEGYYFTNLCCSLEFIKKLSAGSLNLPQAEFDSYMSGSSIPPGSWEASLLMCEGIQTMSHNLKTLTELGERQAKLEADCSSLEGEMEEFGSFISGEVARVLAATAYTIRGPRTPAQLDAPAPGLEEARLPPPLLPRAPPGGDLVPLLLPLVFPEGELPPEALAGGELASPLLPTVPPSLTGIELLSPTQGELPSPLLPAPALGELPSPLLPTAALGEPSLSTYIGFSAQASSIPSISCSTAATDRLLASPASFTPSSSSSSLHSLPSPDTQEAQGP